MIQIKLALVILTLFSGITHIVSGKMIIKEKEEKIRFLYNTKEIVKIIHVDTVTVLDEKDCNCPETKVELPKVPEIKWKTKYRDTCYKGIIKALEQYSFLNDSLTILTNYGTLRIPFVKPKVQPIHAK